MSGTCTCIHVCISVHELTYELTIGLSLSYHVSLLHIHTRVYSYSYSDYDTYQDHTLPVLACDFNDDGTKLATASLDKTGLGFRV